ncbi:MAG: hypothetical protein GF317_16870 [Candidatus Lokiarchaeota archaeon]|nr:hypothetical protein [Candidatus Lokiarchaeota archaeon]MBD3201191.1 hypothetical protein [Candidatus Lokiarchaeota archaeon]
MEEKNDSESELFFQEIIKKTKTGITIPKALREMLFDDSDDIYFNLKVPNKKDKIILEILSEEEVDTLVQEESSTSKSQKEPKKKGKKKSKKSSKIPEPSWSDYFTYDFKNKDKIKPVLETAYYKFAEEPINFDDAMGRVKYALISFLSSTKTENAKLYFSVVKFLVDIINKFNQPNLIEWLYEKVIPNIESKFLYELALLELIPISILNERYEKAEVFVKEILQNIDAYPKSEAYNIMNSFNQLVKKIGDINTTAQISEPIKEKLKEYEKFFTDSDYKIQIIELLEALNYIELAYKIAEELLKNLPSESVKLQEVRKIKKRLKETPI